MTSWTAGLITIACTGEHVCPTCKGTGLVGKLGLFKCTRHIETTHSPSCVSKEIQLSWPPSNDNFCQTTIFDNERKHLVWMVIRWQTLNQQNHNWKLLRVLKPAFERQGSTGGHFFNGYIESFREVGYTEPVLSEGWTNPNSGLEVTESESQIDRARLNVSYS